MRNILYTLIWLKKDFDRISIMKVLKYYLKKKFGLLNNKKVFSINFKYKGKKVKLKLRENNDDFAIVREVFLFEAYRTPSKEKLKIIFDCGSHIGSSATYFYLLNPESEIFCFEPDDSSRELLKKNIKLNEIPARIFPLAISDKKKTVKFNFNEKNPAYSSISQKGVEVQADSVSNLLKFLKIKKIDLIKMDIEGEEINALKGMKKNQTKIFICETHLGRYNFLDLEKTLGKINLKILPPMNHWKKLNKDIEYPIAIGTLK